MIKIPLGFDGAKFAKKYDLGFWDFFVDGNGNLICKSLPGLTDKDIEDCKCDPLPPSHDEKIAALQAMVKRLSGDTKQTDEEIDLMVKTGLITEDTAATMKAEA